MVAVISLLTTHLIFLLVTVLIYVNFCHKDFVTPTARTAPA